jgi:uncharacterized membrane protein YhaH (DUF805 family)
MSYADENQNLEPVLRVLRGTLDFKGRARRTDGIVYYILVTLFVVVLGFVLGPTFELEPAFSVTTTVGTILQLPLIAWLVRRVHDYGLSGLWLLPFGAWIMTRPPYAYLLGLNVSVVQQNVLYWVVGVAVVIAFYCALLWAPDDGPNRFGPNPRLDVPSDKLLGDEGGQ